MSELFFQKDFNLWLIIKLPLVLAEAADWALECLHDAQHFWLHGDQQQFSILQLILSMQNPNPCKKLIIGANLTLKFLKELSSEYLDQVL